ncbi:MAG TPA: 2-succinyl-6-hydroxy-2,4-cyclohexadiene-1-carboxylate synthase, partial [Anaerolineales bacterium]|nr:2-succinyl-6-hydroxy-2,4-cyclohexadiene-1-carboxylate synthase [Anaerolineales bacterium]
MPSPLLSLGPSSLPPLCFLHGFLGAGQDWTRVAEAFSEEFYCLLPDLPGHGQNPLSETLPLHFDLLNQDLLSRMDMLGLSKIHLVGYSMGGRAALYFAVHHPERVASLTLESASPGITDLDERRARAAEDDRRAETLLAGGIEPFVEHWYTLPLFRSLENHPAVRAQIIARRKANNPAWVAQVIGDLSPGRQPAVWDQLSRLEMPVLLLAGALDEKYVAAGKQMAARIPHARLEIVPG